MSDDHFLPLIVEPIDSDSILHLSAGRKMLLKDSDIDIIDDDNDYMISMIY